MKRALAVTLLALACCASKVFGAAASAAFTLETSVPDGFADLTEPQQLVVDLYYGGRSIGSASVSVEPHQLRFKRPSTVLQMIPQTLDPQRVHELLERPLPHNAARLCHSARQQNCGFLEPEEFGIIYDQDRFRVDLFFSPDLLPQQPAIEDPFLPESNSRVSFLQNLSGTWSGVESDGDTSASNASLYGESILSFAESGLHSQWSATDKGDSRIYQLHWTRDYRGRAYSAGLIQSTSGSSLVSSPHLYGFEYRSSNNSRTDRRYSQGAPLEVNMPVRGRVEIYKDGRLIHSELLDAGNRLIDTSGLPGGAYEVEIRTFDESGRTLSQYRHFFAKDSLLPAPNEWRWSLQAGQPAQLETGELLPQRLDSYFLQAGVARRLFDDTGVFTNLAASESEQLLEIGGRWISRYLEVSPSIIRTDDGRNGHRFYALLKAPHFSLSASETRLEDSRSAQIRDFSLLSSGYLQRSVGLNAPLLGGRLRLRYSERDSGQRFESPDFILDTEATAAEKLATLEYRRNFFRNRHWLGELTLAHSDASGAQLTTATIEFRFRGENWTNSARLRGDRGRDANQDGRAGFDALWRDGERWAHRVEQQLSAEMSSDEYYLGSRSRIAGRRGQLNAAFDFRDDRGGQNFNYLGGFSTTLMANGEDFAWGGEEVLDSAVLVDIAGSPEREFEILVDGVRRGYARGDARSAIGLPAFRSYDIQLRPLDDGFYDFREQRETITLYPGNVAAAHYKVETVILVLGRILQAGRPVANAKISIGNYTAVTDGNGLFQMEMSGDRQRLRVPPVRWKDCEIELTEQASGEDWLNLGDIDLSTAKCEGGANRYARH